VLTNTYTMNMITSFNSNADGIASLEGYHAGLLRRKISDLK